MLISTLDYTLVSADSRKIQIEQKGANRGYFCLNCANE